jgi:HlyD family secretion protein
MTQNVVTYTVVVRTDNASGRLIPYLTANVNFEIGQRQNVLLVPNAALRWSPQPEQIAPDHRATTQPITVDGRADDAGDGSAARRAVVWTPHGRFVRPVVVLLGLTDESVTEVSGEEVTEGMEVVVGQQQIADDQPASASPFTPQFRAPRRS